MSKKMSKKDLRLTILDMVKIVGRFSPDAYDPTGINYEPLVKTAWEMVEENKLRWYVLDDGKTIFTAE